MYLVLALGAILAFMAILFIQSGLDKVFDFQGNMEWLKGHFSNSPLKGMVGFMVVTLTLLELASGVSSLLGLIYLIGMGIEAAQPIANYAMILCSTSFLALFFGQRMAKDYAGAASIPAYFIIAVIGFILLSLI
ncbi:DoxX family membrane protein [Luteibaculum oceani]|uniref:DoxX family membrane protein n=1 Tax=Luteibaculum oceani TaxID=1294296 RepID=A0A5C6UYD7_9FLAO|nr:DoxX family membrane protein [Luteibaculum oceani]TXC77066.1 DoxX family membrane protein [Luteibaculum oceani]